MIFQNYGFQPINLPYAYAKLQEILQKKIVANNQNLFKKKEL